MRHSASAASDPALPQLGQRLRLKRSVDVSRLPRQARIVAEAMQRYGLIVAEPTLCVVPVRRAGGPVAILTVDAAAMAQDGHLFYRSANGVWLADAVPAAYLTG
jgi:RNA:NAD 2'-phosphotransferase (TPT1/KptA family)